MVFDGYEFCTTVPAEFTTEVFQEWRSANKQAIKQAKFDMKAEFQTLKESENIAG